MNIFRKRLIHPDANDTSLVMHALGGDKTAFSQIVVRYQNLICSLAYASLGDIKYSEDIAQEVFVEAWKKLDSLQDPEKLKSWLCGILRFKVSHHRRKEANQPLKSAEEICDQTQTSLSSTELEGDLMKEQRQSLLWQVLDGIDTTYREPLVLFYREQQSIDTVAKQLDLTTDTVKKRLSRGRKLLNHAMSSLIEEGLKNSKPTVAFTVGVMAAIGSVSAPAKAASVSATASKTGSIVGWTSLITYFAIFSGVISSYFGIKASLTQSRTQREKKLVIKQVVLFFLVAGVYVASMFTLKHSAIEQPALSDIYTLLSQLVVFGFVLSYSILVVWMLRLTRKLRALERIFEPDAFGGEKHQKGSKKRDFISKLALFGIPLIHIQLSTHEDGDKPAFGWIAGGAKAHGLLFGWGGIAIAPISVGIISTGIISIGAVSFGVFSLGTVAIGILALGSSALAYKAYSSLSSLGWESAFSGGFSIANDAAVGAIAYADHVNNEQASNIVNIATFQHVYLWVLAAMAICIIVPAVIYANRVKHHFAKP